MEFSDFEIRAWQADTAHIRVLVHSSPTGDMRQPVTVPFDAAGLEAFRAQFSNQPGNAPAMNWSILVAGGQQLAATLLPPPVYALLLRSLERISPDHLRVAPLLHPPRSAHPERRRQRNKADCDIQVGALDGCFGRRRVDSSKNS